MFYLIIGGSKVGKSRYAEILCTKISKGRNIYLATMIPVGDGEEGAACISRHRAQRKGLGFITWEEPLNILSYEYKENDTVLLEDVSNLVANHLFSSEGSSKSETAVNDIINLRYKCDNLIAVSFYGLDQKDEYDKETNEYIKVLEIVNKRLIEEADIVVIIKDQKPLEFKGKLPI